MSFEWPSALEIPGDTRVTLRMDTSTLVQEEKCHAFADFVTTKNLMKNHTTTTAMDRGTVMHGLLQRYYHKIWEGDAPHQALNFANVPNEFFKGRNAAR